ncbi:hypothetical protein [Arthrobacter rhombi]|uniref:hypothetical protein n=1 Tax=Arthrobacter rhombi TaxID=71253 RepID=UPI003FD1B5DF
MVFSVALWSSAKFRDRVTKWVDEKLAARGLLRIGPLEEVKIRFWSAVFRVPMESGTAYFKVANPGQAFEGELLTALGHVSPNRVVVPWEVELSEGWSLLPDGGPTLDWASEHDWLMLISDVAELQRQCGDFGALLGMVPRYPVVDVAEDVERLVVDLAGRSNDDRHHMDRDVAAQCLRVLLRLQERMMVLAETGVEPTLQPNDVHPGNAVLPARAGEPSRLFDLGDAIWSHPWAVLHVAARGAGGADLNDPWPDNSATRRFVDAYAVHWPEIDPSDRAEVLDAAEQLGALHRLVPWQRMIAAAGPEGQSELTPRLGDWLARVLAKCQ